MAEDVDPAPETGNVVPLRGQGPAPDPEAPELDFGPTTDNTATENTPPEPVAPEAPPPAPPDAEKAGMTPGPDTTVAPDAAPPAATVPDADEAPDAETDADDTPDIDEPPAPLGVDLPADDPADDAWVPDHPPLAARLRKLAPAPADPAPFAAARDRLKLIRARFDTNG